MVIFTLRFLLVVVHGLAPFGPLLAVGAGC
jgi:hypothetical protein